MIQTKKTIVLCLIIYTALFLSTSGIAAGAEEPQNVHTLQPQGLELAGVYNLRRIEPNLTGEGVKFAVISRSITYTDDEPQNDYRPDTRHNCFKNNRINFYDLGKPPSSISHHSTAICSILLGEDPNAFYPDTGSFY